MMLTIFLNLTCFKPEAWINESPKQKLIKLNEKRDVDKIPLKG